MGGSFFKFILVSMSYQSPLNLTIFMLHFVYFILSVFRVFILNITEDIFVLLYVHFVSIANSL